MCVFPYEVRGFHQGSSPCSTTSYAIMAELVDALDLGSSRETCESSSLSDRTIIIDAADVFVPQKVCHLVGYHNCVRTLSLPMHHVSID